MTWVKIPLKILAGIVQQFIPPGAQPASIVLIALLRTCIIGLNTMEVRL